MDSKRSHAQSADDLPEDKDSHPRGAPSSPSTSQWRSTDEHRLHTMSFEEWSTFYSRVVDQWLTETRSLLECAALCLSYLRDTCDASTPHCQPADVEILLRLGIERVSQAKRRLDQVRDTPASGGRNETSRTQTSAA